MLKEGLDTEVIKRRAEKYGRKLAVSDRLEIEVRARSVDKLDLLNELLSLIRADKLVELLCIGYLTLNAVNKLAASVRVVKEEYLPLISVVNV